LLKVIGFAIAVYFTIFSIWGMSQRLGYIKRCGFQLVDVLYIPALIFGIIAPMAAFLL